MKCEYGMLDWLNRGKRFIVVATCLSTCISISLLSNHLDSNIEVESPNVECESCHEEKPRTASQTNRTILLSLSDMKIPVYEKSFRSPCWYDEYRHKVTLRCLPYFYILGFPKCGTTDFYSRLVSHPLIIGGKEKETHYLNRQFFDRPPKECRIAGQTHCGTFQLADKYFGSSAQLVSFTNDTKVMSSSFVKIAKRNFERSRQPAFIRAFPRESAAIWKLGQQLYKYPGIIVEGTPSNVWDFHNFVHFQENLNYDFPMYSTPDWIHKIYSGSKLIISLRDPAFRAFSDYKMELMWRNKKEKWHIDPARWQANATDFHERVVDTITKLSECLERERQAIQCTTYTYSVRLQIGLYYYYIKIWYEKFPQDQILIFRFEDYVADVTGTLAKVYKFLGLPAISQAGLKYISSYAYENEAWVKGDMFEETKALLIKFFQPFNEKLAEYMNDDRYLWLDRRS